MHRDRKFRVEWLDSFEWLQNRNGNSFCKACDKKLINHLSHLQTHAKNLTHIRNVENKKKQIKIDSFIDTEEQQFQKRVRYAELTLVMFLVSHNLPFLLMDYLPNLLLECCPDSKIAKSLHCGRTKSTQITEILARKAKEKIIAVLRESKFSLIVDETTDISTKKSLVLVVRYMDRLSQSIQDKFLALLELFKTDAESIFQAIKDFFAENEIPFKNLIGLATDGASVMAGEINGVQVKLKQETNLFYVKCSCHSLHLCSAYVQKVAFRNRKTLPCYLQVLCLQLQASK